VDCWPRGLQLALVRSVFVTGSPALAAFDYLLAHAGAASFKRVPRDSAVRSVELQWPDRRLNPFSAQANANYVNFYLRSPILDKHPEPFAAATSRFGQVKANKRGEYRSTSEVRQRLTRCSDFFAHRAHGPHTVMINASLPRHSPR
jgi:hypothetical protein